MDLVGVCKSRILHICAPCQKYMDKNNCYCDFGKYKISEKCSISESILKRKKIERACNKYKKLIHKLKKTGNHTTRNTNSNWNPDIQM